MVLKGTEISPSFNSYSNFLLQSPNLLQGVGSDDPEGCSDHERSHEKSGSTHSAHLQALSDPPGHLYTTEKWSESVS